MEALSAADLLDVWEQGASAGTQERALLLLGRARPDLPSDALGAVPLGSRDADLLGLRQATFGRRMAAVGRCPACGEQLDVEMDAAAIGTELDEPRAMRATIDGREVSVRLPTTDDLMAARDQAAAAGLDRDVARRALIARLVEGDPVTLSPDAEEAVARALAEADGIVDLAIDLVCPACGHAWETTIDVPAYLWEEVVESARRLAREVAELAAAYGWREADVLRLSPWRRRLYIALAAE